jgi:hypothetical protein
MALPAVLLVLAFASCFIHPSSQAPQQVIVQVVPSTANNGTSVATKTSADEPSGLLDGKDCVWEGSSPLCKGKCGKGFRSIL